MKNLLICFLFVTILRSGFCQSPGNPLIDKFAEYPGGVEKFYDYLKTNLKYPADALRDSLAGDVIVGFFLNAEGEVVKESVKVIESLSSSCDAEAIRLIKSAPRWIPAKSKGKDVEQHISFPVSFRMD